MFSPAIRVSTRRPLPKRVSDLGLDDVGRTSALFANVNRAWRTHPSRSSMPRPEVCTVDCAAAMRRLFLEDEAGALRAIEHGEGVESLDQMGALLRGGQSVFLYVDLLAYSLDDTGSGTHLPSAHSTALLILPGVHGWHAYFFNPHGRHAFNDDVYEAYKTRHRLHAFRVPGQSIDHSLVRLVLDALRSRLKAPIAYDGSIVHNYAGKNFQEGDTTGMCFVYPYMLHAYIMLSGIGAEGARQMLEGGKGALLIRRAVEAFMPTGDPRPKEAILAAVALESFSLHKLVRPSIKSSRGEAHGQEAQAQRARSRIQRVPSKDSRRA